MSAETGETDLQNTQETQDDVLAPGTLISGRYKIVEKLAEGGMGRVYIAIQEPIGRRVALKVMRRELVSDEMSKKRFLREAVAASKLHHPNTITVLDYGEAPGRIFFIAMEFLEGESLHQLMERHHPLPLGMAATICSQIARSLAEAHEQGVIHRDLKPENIFISHVKGEGLFVKVLDFGIAKVQEADGTRITRLGYVCGTPEYMSPEQARGEELDGRSDIYALGVMLWEMLVGRVPYDAPNPLGIVLKHQNDPVPPLENDAISDDMKAFVYKTMSKERDERPEDAEAFLAEMMAVVPADVSTSFPKLRVVTGAQRLISPPTTPASPMHATQDVAIAPTLESRVLDDSLTDGDTIDIYSEPPPAPSGLSASSIAAIVVALLLLTGAAVAGVMVMGEEPPAATIAPAPVEVGLQITIEPEESKILLDGKFIGKGSQTLTGEPGSTLALEFLHEGYVSDKRSILLPEQGTVPLNVVLVPVETPLAVVKLTLESQPPGAAIFKGKEKLAVTPHTLEMGESDPAFDVEVKLDGHETRAVRVDPSKGLVQTLTFDLVEKKSAPVSNGAVPPQVKRLPKSLGRKVTERNPVKVATPKKNTPADTPAGGKRRYKTVE